MIVNLRESLNTRDRKSVNGNSKYYDLVNLYESCNLSADNKKTLAKMINNNASDKAIYSFLYECYEGKEDIKEDTVKKDNKWVNKGKEGTHGEFKTKKAADAQRKAMFANGYKGEFSWNNFSLKQGDLVDNDYDYDKEEGTSEYEIIDTISNSVIGYAKVFYDNEGYANVYKLEFDTPDIPDKIRRVNFAKNYPLKYSDDLSSYCKWLDSELHKRLNESLKESSDSFDCDEIQTYSVVRVGGSIGEKSFVVVKSGLSKEEANEYAKVRMKSLSPGEKKYYGIKYKVVPDEKSSAVSSVEESLKAKNQNEAEEILYVIKDSHGNQLSKPNADDSELWDRVASMEAHGRRGLCVVVYTGKKESLAEDKGQPRSNRYTTYFNRIKRAIEKGDEETLKRTKEAIMYAPAKELKNSEASELMNMIKNRKITESVSGKYGEVKYEPRRDGMSGESAVYANYHLFSNDGKYTPYWAGERPMGSSYNSIEDAVKGIDAFIDKQRKDGKMLYMKPVNEASYGEAFDKEGGPFWYFTRHVVQPGAVPKGIQILDIIDCADGSGAYFKSDKVLTTKELNDFEIVEKKPEGLKESLNLNEAKNIINVLNKNLRVRFKHSAGGIFSLDRTPFNEDTFNELIKNNYKMIGDILKEQGLKYDISEDAYISKDANLYVTIYGDTNGIIVQFEEMESESLKESVNSDIVSMIKKQFPKATVKTSVRKHSDVHKSNPDTPVGKTKYVDIRITPDSASSVNSILQYCNHNIKKVLSSDERFDYYGDVPARNPRGSKEVILSYQDYSGLSDDEYKSLLGESVAEDLNRYEFLVKRYGHEEDRETITAISLKDAEDQLNSDGHVEYWDYLPDFNYDEVDNESLKESLESEDGWSEEILDIVDPFFIEVEKVAYELRNTVRGAYRFGTTVKDLAQVFRGFSETTDDIANELDNNQEHLEEDWRTGTFTRDDLMSYRAEMKKRVEGVVYSIRSMKEKHPEYAEIFDNLTDELVDILSLSYMNESLKESTSIKEEPHEECVGNNCTDEHDLFPEEKYFTIVVTRSDDGEDEIIDDVTKEIADKYIDDLKRDNDEFFSHAKVLDHNGEVVNSWEYLEEAAKSKKSSSIKDRLKKLIPDLDI